MKYCENCGKELKDGAAFCNECGTKTEETKKDRPFLVLSASRKAGIVKRIICYIVFYDDEMLIAHIDKDKQKDIIEEYKKEQKASGKGAIKTAIGMINMWKNYSDKYYSVQKSEIMMDDPSNIRLGYSEIQKFVFRAVSRNTADDMNTTTSGEIVIKTNAEKLKFSHTYYDSNKQIKKRISNVLSKRFKYRGGGVAITIGKNKDDIN